MYRWILGDCVDDPEACTALATLVAGPVAEVGGLLGVRDGDRVVAAMVWYPSCADADVASRAHADQLRTLAARPDMARRLLDFWAMDLMPAPAADSVNIALAVTDPTVRQAGMLRALVRPVEAYCIGHDVPFHAWTGSEALRNVYRDSFGLTQFATDVFDDTTLYGLVSARPPIPSHPH